MSSDPNTRQPGDPKRSLHVPGPEAIVESVSAYLSRIEELKQAEEESGNDSDFIYRGQPLYRCLLPRLARIVPKGERLKIEELMFAEFARTCVALTPLPLENDWDRLAVAQHHGMPTRLLDWTYSALAALWFAVHEGQSKKVLQATAVWLLKTHKEDFINGVANENLFDRGTTKIYRPRLITPRIAAQGGLFTAHKMLESEGFYPLEKQKSFKDRLVMFIVPPYAFPEILQTLNGCNVNYFSMFPDLGGLCKHLEWQYTRPSSDVEPDCSAGETSPKC